MLRLKVLFSVVALVALLALSLTACAPSEYKLSSSSNPDAGGTISPATGTYQKEVGVDVTATPASGYRFDHWEGGASGESPAVHVVMDSNKNLVAYFTKTYVLSASSTPASGGSVSPTSGTYDEADNVTIIAAPAQYYKFNGWAGDASGSSDHLTLTMDSDKKVVASFTKLTYSLQTQVDASGGGTVDPGSGTFEAGSQVTITATPASGYRFNHWGGSATGTSNPVNAPIDTNKTVTAYFTKVYTLSVSSDPVGSGSINPNSGVYDAGTVVTLTPVAVFPYVLDHWSGSNNDTINPTTVTMNADTSVTAHFRLLSPEPPNTANRPSVCVSVAIPIDLEAGQWLQAQFTSTHADPVNATDPNGTLLKDLGIVTVTNFTLQAQITGTYYVNCTNYDMIMCSGISLTYTIYS